MLLAPLAGAAAGSLFGGGGTKANIPGDLRGMRQGNIDLLSNLLGFGSRQLTGFKGTTPQFSTRGGAGSGDPTSRLESFFGSLTSPLQRQATQGMSQFLNQPAPETRAFDMALPALQQVLGQKPGQGIIDALQPSFERNLASANQQGGRFSSGNAILRSRALEDFNLLGAQAAQQGINQQMQAANVLGMLGQSAGAGPFGRLAAALGAGDLEPSRRIGLLQSLLGTSQQAVFGQPTTVTPGGAQQGLQAGFGIAQLIPFLGMLGGQQLFGGGIPSAAPFPGFDPNTLPVLKPGFGALGG